eukprot:TRINITY_DN4255_c0_g1_i2.p1 TRINITY_DN4255_c0_g1~~TRINITY_DN4255_c0_g1_i2.p1  ORF type:complete len:355 (+),score=77.56 TRINITY_DN4255_c0_g1_i2:109-1065(+)
MCIRDRYMGFENQIIVVGGGNYSKKMAQAEKTSFENTFINLPMFTGKDLKSSQTLQDNDKDDKQLMENDNKPNQKEANQEEAMEFEEFKNQPEEKQLKNYCHGGQLVKEINDKGTDYDWIQHGDSPPLDFLTLVRYTVITALCQKAYINVRQILSGDGKQIILVLKAQKLAIYTKAMEKGMNKQLELGAVDLLSFEPFDPQLRPLRIKKFVRSAEALKKEVTWEEEKQFESVDTKTRKYYQKVKKMELEEFQAVLCQKQVKLDKLLNNVIGTASSMMFSTEIEGDQPVNREMWEAYFCLLYTSPSPRDRQKSRMPSSA